MRTGLKDIFFKLLMVNLTPKKILIQLMKIFLSSGKFKSNHVKGTLSTYPIEEKFYRGFLYTLKNCMGGWACSTSIKCLFRNSLVNILWKFQLPSSYCLGLMILWRFGGKGSLTHSLTDWLSDKAVCRTAPATPGLLIISAVLYWFRNH